MENNKIEIYKNKINEISHQSNLPVETRINNIYSIFDEAQHTGLIKEGEHNSDLLRLYTVSHILEIIPRKK